MYENWDHKGLPPILGILNCDFWNWGGSRVSCKGPLSKSHIASCKEAGNTSAAIGIDLSVQLVRASS